ncbi:unnamed protein product, partial [Ectocarpus sp. 12 AP-2014]
MPQSHHWDRGREGQEATTEGRTPAQAKANAKGNKPSSSHSMPVGEGVGGQDGSAATLVRSDQDSGMALVKSKDGRTKWLTVSTDPTSTPPSTTWDER